MAIRGARPKPTVVKLVTNTARRKNQPRAATRGLPKPPKYLDEGAREAWDEAVKDLYDAGILAVTDRTILAAYCQAVSRWQHAELALQAARANDDTGSFGLLIEGRKGTVINPLVGAANRTMLIVSRLCVELGMTPSARTRVHVLPEDRIDPAEKYLVE